MSIVYEGKYFAVHFIYANICKMNICYTPTFEIGFELRDNSLNRGISWKDKLGTIVIWLWFKSNLTKLLRSLKACLSIKFTWHWLSTISCRFNKLLWRKTSFFNWLMGFPMSSRTCKKYKWLSYLLNYMGLMVNRRMGHFLWIK